MTNNEVALLTFITIGWMFSRQIILKYRSISRWIDIIIAAVFVVFTLYAVYDTFLNTY